MSHCRIYKRKLDATASPAERIEAEWAYTLAVEIDKRLKARGLSRRDFAQQLGKRPTEVSRWLSGKHHFALRTVALISAALGEDLLASGIFTVAAAAISRDKTPRTSGDGA